jgi:hypothetical protein
MILVYASNITPRVKYIFHFIFHDILNIAYKITSERVEFERSNLARINYSETELEGTLKIIPHTLLFETGIKEQNIRVTNWKNTKVFFQTDSLLEVPFDLFASSFYILTRYEEYLPHNKDGHGRFPAEESLAFKNDFLEEPVVDQWAFLLADVIKRRYPDFILPERKFRYIPTIDIDIAYAYRYKGFGRTIGAFAKDLIKFNLSDNLFRVKVLLGLEKDPYDTYDFFRKLHERYNLTPVFFFLVGRYSRFDKNHSIRKKEYRELIQKISDIGPVGLHPSYGSNSDFNALKREAVEFSQLIGRKVERSRQHFLKLTFPETYRNLNKLGIKEDYTMGFASKPGFRAGTCTSFHFYDLEMEEQTLLRIYPFQVMDGTLNQYIKLNPQEAVEKIRKIVTSVKFVQGTFISLWHNESVGEQRDWKGWSGVYEEVLKICKSK